MTRAWYIDTIDARSGYAFASHRVQDLNDTTALFDSTDTFFIEAPQFVPERVSSRAVSFGAARASFQTGLFFDVDNEVAFPTLSAVAEFVRRAYGSGGSTDDDGGSTPAPFVPPTPKDGDGEAVSSEPPFDGPSFGNGVLSFDSFDPVAPLINGHQDFLGKVGNAVNGGPVLSGDAFARLNDAASAGDGRGCAARLGRAALRLAIHILSFPEETDRHNRRRLHMSARSVLRCISEMRLLPAMYLQLQQDSSFSARIAALIRDYYQLPAYQDFYESPWATILPLQDPAVAVNMLATFLVLGRGQPSHEYNHFFEAIFRSYRRLSFDRGPSVDRFADLARVVIPDHLIPAEYRPAKAAPSLRHLLAFACNSLAQIPKGTDVETFELLLFGACYLSSNVVNLPLEFAAYEHHWYDYEALGFDPDEDALLRVMTALPWLKSNLPQYAFHRDVEEFIAKTATLSPNAPRSESSDPAFSSGDLPD
ncbi:hypothetical protein [Paraburkholderia sp. J10-1]|uniref:hypothetical protein n=1 Tax=Paraburkholderia sp. J10-1 TaxID=2805430 RepID=UPI002AB78CE8|nr:hypothetical protein [Paraburkholderia sp. J10-1]